MPGDPAREFGYQLERKKQREALIDEIDKCIFSIKGNRLNVALDILKRIKKEWNY